MEGRWAGSGSTIGKSPAIADMSLRGSGVKPRLFVRVRGRCGGGIRAIPCPCHTLYLGMSHLADLFKHAFTGGTHPFDIHEYLVLDNQSRGLGSDLV